MAEVQQILAVKLADLGDVLLTEPALRSLRHGFPDAAIDVLTTPVARELVPMLDQSLIPLVFPKALFDRPQNAVRPDHLSDAARLGLRLRRRNYDLVVLFHHLTTAFGTAKFHALVSATGAPKVIGLDNGRGTFLDQAVDDLGFGAMHEAEYMLAVARKAGGAVVDPAPAIRHQSLTAPDRFGLPDSYVAVFPATGEYSAAREWPASRYAELCKRLTDGGVNMVVVGANDARDYAAVITLDVPGAIDLSGRTSLEELVRVIATASMAIGGDSFIGHLAAAVQTPVVSIFGPSNAEAWRPFGTTEAPDSSPSSGIVLRDDIPCSPCFYTGYRLGRPQGCPARTCIHNVTVDQVHAMIEEAGLARGVAG